MMQNKIKYAMILAGGFGTRLAHVVKDVPKPMAPVVNKPFLEYIITYLKPKGIEEVILLTGYKSEVIEAHFGDGQKWGVNIRYSIEKDALGTGGAIVQALDLIPDDEAFLVLNGDTFFDIDLEELYSFHLLQSNQLTLSLKYREDVKRYGSVEIDDYRVKRFREKDESLEDGYINGGVYLMEKSIFKPWKDSGFLSFESDIMPKILMDDNINIGGIPFGGKFIDIGIPEDYKRANEVLPQWMAMNKIRVVFLDRDGIINEDGGYTHRIEDLRLVEGVIPFLKTLASWDFQFVIVTNQAGIAKEKFGVKDYKLFESALEQRLKAEGIAILDTFYCPYHSGATDSRYRRNSLQRKPEPGMVLKAADEYFIDIKKSYMIGDKQSDRIHLPYLRSVLLEGKYPLDEHEGIVCRSFKEILEDIERGKDDCTQ